MAKREKEKLRKTIKNQAEQIDSLKREIKNYNTILEEYSKHNSTAQSIIVGAILRGLTSGDIGGTIKFCKTYLQSMNGNGSLDKRAILDLYRENFVPMKMNGLEEGVLAETKQEKIIQQGQEIIYLGEIGIKKY